MNNQSLAASPFVFPKKAIKSKVPIRTIGWINSSVVVRYLTELIVDPRKSMRNKTEIGIPSQTEYSIKFNKAK
jgi:hypothetical protein